LLQAEVAKLLTVCEDTIVGWEMRGTNPRIQQMQGIIKMIGYNPVEIDISTFSGRIINYRYINGMSPKEFGKLIPADPSTVLDWEKRKHLPSKKKRLKIEAIIKERGIK
jgi:DNA-binding transcriptional regulator YiaG